MSKLEFVPTMDPFAIVARRSDGTHVASIHTHPGRPPRLVTYATWSGPWSVELDELVELTAKLAEVSGRTVR